MRVHSVVHARHLRSARYEAPNVRGVLERDLMFAHIEGLLEAPRERARCASPVSVSVHQAGGELLRGTVERDPTNRIVMSGPLFTYSYMSADGVCTSSRLSSKSPYRRSTSLFSDASDATEASFAARNRATPVPQRSTSTTSAPR
jgi:hypothetical protein